MRQRHCVAKVGKIGAPQVSSLWRSYLLVYFVVQPLRLQPIRKGLPGDANHVADADRLERSGVGELIGRSAADTENGCDVIHGVCSALGRSLFVGCVGAHKIILHLC